MTITYKYMEKKYTEFFDVLPRKVSHAKEIKVSFLWITNVQCSFFFLF